MSSSALAAGLRYLRGKLAAQQGHEECDEQLLRAFLSNHDGNAFAALVRRHGPMVFRVCRRVLGHEQDAEDAFQATFLVLAHNPAAWRNKSSLAGFLHGIAYRTALKARQTILRRRKHEGSLGALKQPRSPADPADELSWREVRVMLDEEIACLPEIYRSVFVLCCLAGASRAEAARRLGVKEGTVSSRLTTARQRLAHRLARRGVELTAILAAVELATQTASALLPAGLMANTMKAVTATAAGECLGKIVSTSVAELVQGATAALRASKVKIAALVLLTVATSGSLVFWYGRASGPLAATLPPPAVKFDDKLKAASPQREAAKTVAIQGRVLGTDGKSKAGAKLLLLDSQGHVKPLGSTAADGRFSIAVADRLTKQLGHWLIAQANGSAIDFLVLHHWKGGKPVELHLGKDHAIRGRVVNTEGKPIRGVRVAVTSIDDPPSLDSFLIAWKKRSFGSGIASKKCFRTEGNALIAATTDAEGRFAIDGAGSERLVSLHFSGGGIAEEERCIVNRAGFDPEPYNQAVRDKIPKGAKPYGPWFLHGPNVPIVAEAEKPIFGIVTDADTGKPVSGVRLECVNQKAKTDAEGRYRIHGVHKGKSYTIDAASDPATGYMASQVHATDTAGYQPLRADLRIKKGVIITGKVIDRATGQAVPGYAAAAILADNPFAKDYPEFSSTSLHGDREYTEGNGAFRIVTIPGPVLLMVGFDHTQSTGNAAETLKYDDPLPDPEYPHYFQKPQHWLHYRVFGGGTGSVQGAYCKVLQIKPGAKVVHQDALLRRAPGLPVNIEDAEGRPLRGAWATGIGAPVHPLVRIDEASCLAYGLTAGKRRLMVFYHPGRKLAGTLTLAGNEKQPATVKLRPMGSVQGRLVDPGGKPLAGIVVDLWYRDQEGFWVREHSHWEKQVVTDAAGAFTLDEVVPELKFHLSFQRRKHRFEREAKAADSYVHVKTGECRDLGAIRVKQLPDDD